MHFITVNRTKISIKKKKHESDFKISSWHLIFNVYELWNNQQAIELQLDWLVEVTWNQNDAKNYNITQTYQTILNFIISVL